MRLVDPSIELVACGSSNSRMPTFGAWEATVLAETYDVVDYVSMHTYYEQRGDDRDSFLASAVDMDAFIEAVVATADHARAVGRPPQADPHLVRRVERLVPEPVRGRSRTWRSSETPRLIEDVYSVTDAVVVGNLLISLLRHADRVRIGCQAQLVNVIAPDHDRAGRAGVAADHLPPVRADLPARPRHRAAASSRDGPRHETAAHGEVPLLDAVAVLAEDPAGVVLFAVNRDQRQELTLDVDVRALPDADRGRARRARGRRPGRGQRRGATPTG